MSWKRMYGHCFMDFRPDRMMIEELERGFRQLVSKLYSESATDGRRKQFKRQLRQARIREREKKGGSHE